MYSPSTNLVREPNTENGLGRTLYGSLILKAISPSSALLTNAETRVFRFRLVFDLSFILSLSKGHHERITLVRLNNEKP